MYEIKTQFRLVIGLEAENVVFRPDKINAWKWPLNIINFSWLDRPI